MGERWGRERRGRGRERGGRTGERREEDRGEQDEEEVKYLFKLRDAESAVMWLLSLPTYPNTSFPMSSRPSPAASGTGPDPQCSYRGTCIQQSTNRAMKEKRKGEQTEGEE